MSEIIDRLGDYAQEHPVQTFLASTSALVMGGTLLRRSGREEKPIAESAPQNFYDHIGDLSEWIEQGFEPGDAPEHFLLGGGISAAIMDRGTRIVQPDPRSGKGGEIIVTKGLFKPRVRANGRVADIDCLIRTSDQTVREKVRQNLTPLQSVLNDEAMSPEAKASELRKPGNFLKIGICGLTPLSEYAPARSGFLSNVSHNLKKDFVSQRVDEGNGSTSWRIADIVQELPEASFQKWDLVLPNGKRIPTLHPVVIMACYAARTSHGVRERDVEKLEKMAEVLGPVFGIRLQWDQDTQQVEIIAHDRDNPIYGPAIKFVNAKNRLRYNETKQRMGRRQAGLLAAKIALHRFADAKLERFGQGGWLYDNVVSRFSDEDQSAIE